MYWTDNILLFMIGIYKGIKVLIKNNAFTQEKSFYEMRTDKDKSKLN